MMNVTAHDFGAYLEKFHTTLRVTAEKYLLPEEVRSLFHLSFLPSTIRGYVSTQYGVAWEYVQASLTTVQMELGSRSVDDLLLQRPSRFGRMFSRLGSIMNIQDASNVHLDNVSMTNAPVPFRLRGHDVHITLVDCHFDALGWSRDIKGAEVFGNRDALFWSSELAAGRAKDEVLLALTETRKAASYDVSIGDYVNTRKQKSVLLLGDYSNEGKERLRVISGCLADLGYSPLLVSDVPDLFSTSLGQKVAILGGIVRFVIIDDSSRSGHLSEVQIADQNRWTTVLLHAGGERGSCMTAGLPISSSNFHEEDYELADPCEGLKRAVVWAETRLERDYKNLYPWRTP